MSDSKRQTDCGIPVSDEMIKVCRLSRNHTSFSVESDITILKKNNQSIEYNESFHV